MHQTLELIGMDHALIGTMVAGRYQVQRLLAKGGMGRLYLAIQQPLGRKVVVKVMPRRARTPKFMSLEVS